MNYKRRNLQINQCMESIIKDFLSPDSVFYRLRTFNVYGLVVVILKLPADAKKRTFIYRNSE